MERRQAHTTIDPDFLLEAYASGFFPMADPKSGEISWYSPDPRAILPVRTLRIPRTLRRIVARNEFEVRTDTAFGEVIRSCARRDETWISPAIVQVFETLHRRGLAHSVECWDSGRLVGGLYGVALRGAFFGESMFSLRPNASKVALVRLSHRLSVQGFVLHDTQFLTPHLESFGARSIPRSEYLDLLASALCVDAQFGN